MIAGNMRSERQLYIHNMCAYKANYIVKHMHQLYIMMLALILDKYIGYDTEIGWVYDQDTHRTRHMKEWSLAPA